MTKQINGFVELPAQYVSEMAFGAMKWIKKQRDKNRQDAIRDIMFDVPFRKLRQKLGLKIKARTEEQCVKILKERNYGFWWFYNVSHLEDDRYKQMQELAKAAGHEKPMLVNTDIAAYLKFMEYEV